MANIFSSIWGSLVSFSGRMIGRPLTAAGRIFSISTPEVFTKIDTKKAIAEGFNDNTIVYTVVKKDAQKFGCISRYVYNTASKEEKAKRKRLHKLIETKAFTQSVPTGPTSAIATLTALINRPNPYQSQDAFYTLVRAYHKVCGEAFIWCNRGDISSYIMPNGAFDDIAIDRLPILEMYVLPSDYVTIIPDMENLWGVNGYILEAGERLVMRKNDVIHWKDINLTFEAGGRQHLRGMPALRPGSRTLGESNSIASASLRQSQNDGAKAVIYEKTLNAKMSPTQQTQLQNVIDNKLNSVDKSGAVATLQGDWGLLDLAMSSRDMQMIEKKKMSWQEIALLFDVPPEIFITDQKYDNMGNAMLQWVYSLVASAKQLDGEFNRILPKSFGLDGSVFIGSDPSELPEVQGAMIANAKLLQDIWSVPPNDILEMLGYDRNPDPSFDEPWVTSGRTPLSQSQLNDQMSQEIQSLANARSSAGY